MDHCIALDWKEDSVWVKNGSERRIKTNAIFYIKMTDDGRCLFTKEAKDASKYTIEQAESIIAHWTKQKRIYNFVRCTTTIKDKDGKDSVISHLRIETI
jgi:hypothetical protein